MVGIRESLTPPTLSVCQIGPPFRIAVAGD